MNESTITPAFNKAAPRRVIKVKSKPSQKRRKKSKTKSRLEHTPARQGHAPVMTLDVEEYLHQFKDFVMTEEEKIIVLEALWSIMCDFVLLGFGMDSHNLTCEQNHKSPRLKNRDLVNFDDLKNDNDTNAHDAT